MYFQKPTIPAIPMQMSIPAILAITPTSPAFAAEAAFAVDDALSVLRFKKEFQYPKIVQDYPYQTTASSRWHKIRKAMGFFHEERNLQETEEHCTTSPIGYLPLAVARAIGRANPRAETAPARILEIGAGQRIVAAGLKTMFGESIITTESSPAYSRGYGIDEELPAAGIDDAELTAARFDMAFSIFGNIYGKDQLNILGKVVGSLKPGGEFFLMWKPTLSTLLLHRKIGQKRGSLLQNGLAISTDLLISGFMSIPETLIVAWGQKLSASADPKETLSRGISEPNPALRLSSYGNYLLAGEIQKEALEDLAARIIVAACNYIGISPSELRNKIFTPADKVDSEAIEEMAKMIVKERYGFSDPESYGDWMKYMPLSFCAASFIAKALPYIGTDTNYTAHIGKIMAYHAMLRR